jgi:SulP family sulfate permease
LEKIEKALTESSPPLQGVIIDANPVNNADFSAIVVLKEIIESYAKRNITICFAGLKGSAFTMMKVGGVINLLGADHFFYHVQV